MDDILQSSQFPGQNTAGTAFPDRLTKDLNYLLASLALPITVSTPYDLTPSLLLVILESILRDRLPISVTARESRTSAAKVEAMKVFLGVLEDDVLQTDIGLSEIDPRRLAAGLWDEVVFVGETLCWLGRRQEQIGHEYDSQVDHPEACSSGGSPTITSVVTGFSRYGASETTATTLNHASEPPAPDTPTPIPQCIHQFDISSFSFDSRSAEHDLSSLVQYGASELEDTSHGYPSPPSVRYHGLIRPVEHDVEQIEFWHEHPRSRSAGKVVRPERTSTQHTSPMQYTISLLNERARILEAIAKLKNQYG
ncbi:hypothetical protein JB92DRAFT_3063844 [Gautieria morchelliformis]|nr:hypothetical protein JB92DRAFT_3063844 [Gautieria morchelliformis]